MQEDLSLVIAVLCNGTIQTDTASCLFAALGTLPFPKHVGFITGGYPAFSRNLAVKNALEHKVSHLMFIDSDQTFPPDAIRRLLEHKKDIIGANYNERRLPLISVTKLMGDNGKMLDNVAIPKELSRAYSIGTGFMLIKMSVFDAIPYPWFNTQLEPDFKTEDVYFCENARNAGYDIWCDPALAVGHIGSYNY